MHDSAHFGVNEAQVHTDSLTVRTKSLVLKSPPNLPEWGHNSGKRLKMVDFGSLASWCEPRATPCKPGSRECGQAPRTAQRPSDPRPMAPPALCLARRRASCDTKTKPQPRRAIRARLFDLCSQRKPVTHASRSQHVRSPPVVSCTPRIHCAVPCGQKRLFLKNLGRGLAGCIAFQHALCMCRACQSA